MTKLEGERPFTSSTYHARVIAECFDQTLSDDDAMLVMTLLHMYCFRIPASILRDSPDSTGFAALTQRHASECLARVWRKADEPRSDSMYFYWKWNLEWGAYGRLESLASDERVRMGELKQQIEAHPAVEELAPEDWDIISGEG